MIKEGARMSTSRREDSLYKHKYRELLKAIDDAKQEIRQKIEYKTNLSIKAYIDCLQIINKHIEKENG